MRFRYTVRSIRRNTDRDPTASKFSYGSKIATATVVDQVYLYVEVSRTQGRDNWPRCPDGGLNYDYDRTNNVKIRQGGPSNRLVPEISAIRLLASVHRRYSINREKKQVSSFGMEALQFYTCQIFKS